MTRNRRVTRPVRDRNRRILAKGEPPCHLCGEPIDYTAPRYHPDSFEADHITPIAKGGLDTLENLLPSHRRCNRAKSDKLPTEKPGVIFATDREW